MNLAMKNLLEKLQRMTPLHAKDCKTPSEEKIHRISNRLLWVAVVFFLGLLLLAAMTWLVPALRENFVARGIALGLGALAQFFTLISMVAYLLAEYRGVKSGQHDVEHRQALAIERDFRNIELLLEEPVSNLVLVRQWLSSEIDRVNTRFSLFFGSPDKVAVFGLLAALWAFGEGFSRFELPDWGWLGPVGMFLAACIGFGLGSLTLKGRYLPRLIYQRHLVDLAVEWHKQNEKKGVCNEC